MENEEVMLLEKEAKEFCFFSINLKVTEILALCIQPTNIKEMEAILSKFWNEFKGLSKVEMFCEFDFVCMYAFNYVYKENSTRSSVVSKSVYVNLAQNALALREKNRNRFINCRTFLTGLREVVNFDSENGEYILLKSLTDCLIDGNVACGYFLVKFGLFEVCKKSREILANIVKWFNDSYELIILNEQANYQTSMQLEDVLNRIAKSEFNFRRFILVFCAVCIVAEYKMCEKLESWSSLILLRIHMKHMCIRKITCLDLIISSTTETKITFRDIEIFAETVLNQQFGTEFGETLVETSRKILTNVQEFYNPRSLKDLSRCKIRECVPSSTLLTEQVSHLALPADLKKFILFDNDEFLGLLMEHQIYLHLLSRI